MGIQINGQTDTVTSTTAGGSVKVTPLAASTGLNVGTGASISSPATNVLTLGTNNLERVRVSAAGYFGIGTNNPQTKLEVAGAAAFTQTSETIGTDQLQIGFNAPNGFIKSKNSSGSPASNLDFYSTDTSGNTNLGIRLQYTGNTGIGTNNPTSLLHLSSTTAPQLNVQAPASGGADSQLRISSSAGNYRRIIFYDSAVTPTKNNFEIAVQEVDNSLFFGPSTAVGGLTFSGSTGLIIDSSGRTTTPSQVSFAARVATQQTNVTGNAVYFTLIADSTSATGSHNVGSHYSTSTGVFTAPVTGRYYFNAHVLYDNSVLTRFGELWLSYNNDSTRWFLDRRYWASGGNITAIGGSVVINVTAGDNIRVRGFVAGGVQDVDVQGSAEPIAHFSGYLLG